jgi:hypothetical protein
MPRYRILVIRRAAEILPGILVTLGLLKLTPPSTTADTVLQVSVGLMTSILGLILVDGAVLEAKLSAYRRDLQGLLKILAPQLSSGAFARSLLEIGSLEVPGDDFQRFYRNALWSIERSYVTTFLATQTSATESHNRLALEIQRIKVRVSGATIRRLFIFADEAQRDAHSAMMQSQIEAGLEVRFLFDELIKDSRELTEWANKLDYLDFSIIDDRLILRTTVASTLGHRTAVSRSLVSSETGLITDFQFFFSLLWDEAKPA